MILADVSASAYFLSPMLILASAATIIGFVVALILSLPQPTRKTAQQVFRIAVYSVAFEVGLLLLLLALDTR
jgi:hypothetical protein